MRIAASFGAETAVIAAGGALGSLVRWALGELVDTRFVATLTVNLVGCLLIGVVAARRRRGDLLWHALVTGGLGGFTTFSTFSHETRDLLAAARPIAAACYVALTLFGGVAAAAATQRGRR